MTRPQKPELMSPAGDWPQLQTAIESGADAVYFGLNHFTARAKVGFSVDDLPEVIQTLHSRGVKGFVTFNTLVFDHEIEQAESAIIQIASAGVDAVIVQDIGVVQLIRQIAPELEIHGSTQMSITSSQGAELARSLGCKRVVLGRELSLADIRKIANSTEVELEVFVHGALCVSYSGQCFSSEAWGGRSANRGQCAQACRLSYDLIVDGTPRDLGEYRYLLSPGDLSALEHIAELVEIGIACLKIEGRYKGSPYVAQTTRAYREAIDLACLGLPVEVSDQERLALEQVYSRGLGPHFISGTNHQDVVVGRAPRHRGVQVGVVADVYRNSVDVHANHPIHRGDGLVFDAADWRSPDQPEEGGRVYQARRRDDDLVELEFGHHDVDFSRIRAGDLVWRTNDPQLTKRLKPLTQTEVPVFTRPVRFEVTAKQGQPISIVATLPSGQSAMFTGDAPLVRANKRALDQEILHEKLGRLGGTPFHLDQIELVTNDDVFVPTSLLNYARRQLVDRLFDEGGKIRPIPASAGVDWVREQIKNKYVSFANQAAPRDAALHLLVRTPEQLDAAIEVAGRHVGSITLDYLELYGLRPAVEKIKSHHIRPRVASPRILKPSEQNVIRFLLSLECDILVRSGGLLYDLVNQVAVAKDVQLIGDFSLNAANAVSAWAYLDLGLSQITPTYDLNWQQVVDLTGQVPAAAIEAIAYSHLPVFHTEHCVFCRFLSDGTDHTNCGHPCEKHQVAVRDHQNRAHPVMADVGCRNTVFGAQAQFDGQALEAWRKAGIGDFRLEFVHQSGQQVRLIVDAFDNYFDGAVTGDQLAETLAQGSEQSVTQGSLYVPGDFKNLVQLK